MAKVVKKDDQQLILTSYPKCIVGVVFIFLAIFWGAALTSEQAIAIDFYLIFNGVALVVLAVQKHKLSRFDKKSKMVCLISKSILGKKEQWYPLVDIDAVDMNYGRGQFAKGGSVNLVINSKLINIIDSDICVGNRERNIRLKDEVANWL
ncbi:hypothetical protein [Catenovulum adriaticum]|uniref:PH (Pleckstrin Homology) domain-containing protein n=1 Tax=Catenovulum adriaticum TaxID=2984846 RepID=A0ABY7AKS0_9ALTE|nr:hypothetical protein [Catenovulum sp. TS8]WAJ70158.1 hypothetical protein OLW01_13595 [Catenovulum sp. TS8]